MLCKIRCKERRLLNKDKFIRRIVQYAMGLIVMALGVVCLKRAELGISPITSVPAAIANITPFTLGNTTIMLHALCVVGQIAVARRLTLKSLLTLIVGFPFGYIIDFFMWLFPPAQMSVIARAVILIVGLALSGLGVQMIVGSDLMLPAPDELSHTISKVYNKSLSSVKIISDAIYVAAALSLDLIFTGTVSTVGLGTVLSVLLTGRFIGWFNRLFPKLKMEPLWQ